MDVDIFGRSENVTGTGGGLNVVAERDDLFDWGGGNCRRDELGGGSSVGLRR